MPFQSERTAESRWRPFGGNAERHRDMPRIKRSQLKVLPFALSSAAGTRMGKGNVETPQNSVVLALVLHGVDTAASAYRCYLRPHLGRVR